MLNSGCSQRFAAAAKCLDFSAKDIHRPEPDRTRAIFSAFINFVKFSEQCETFINGLREKSTAAIEERDRIVQQVDEVRQKVAHIKCVTFRFLMLMNKSQESVGRDVPKTSRRAKLYGTRI